MNLQQQQVTALTNLLFDFINKNREEEYQIKFNEKKQELQMKFDADIEYVKACLQNCPFKVIFYVPIHSDGIGYGEGYKISDYLVKQEYPLLLVDKYSIEQDIWLESIEATNLQSLVQKIKDKYNGI